MTVLLYIDSKTRDINSYCYSYYEIGKGFWRLNEPSKVFFY